MGQGPVAHSNPFWLLPYLKINHFPPLHCFLEACKVSGNFLKYWKSWAEEDKVATATARCFWDCIPASFKTITNATNCWGICCKQSQAIEKENRKEHGGVGCCKGETCQAQGKSGRHLPFMLNALSVWNAVRAYGVFQPLTASDMTADNVTWLVMQPHDPLRRVTFIPSWREIFADVGGQS